MEQLRVGDESYGFHKLDAAATRLPYTLRILLENVLRNGSEEEAEAVSDWVADAEPSREISFHPARVLLQDFTGVPAVVDLAAMRDAMRRAGRRPEGDQPADPGRARDRPLGAGGRVRVAARDRAQRRARVRAEPRALRLPSLGPGRLRQLPRRAAEHRASSTRSTSSTSRGWSRCATASLSPTRSSAPTRTRRWSTGSASSAGASAASRPRRRCSGRRSRCSCRRSWASG